MANGSDLIMGSIGVQQIKYNSDTEYKFLSRSGEKTEIDLIKKVRSTLKKTKKESKKKKDKYESFGLPGSYVKCAVDHPPLKLNDGFMVYGGSCTSRVPEGDYDVYICLDAGAKMSSNSYPWIGKVEFLYRIQDMGVPDNMVSFRSLIEYMEASIQKGLKVFVGCIGGHGRTGLVLSVLVKRMVGIDDAISYVRSNYCKKAVESQEQVDWLHKNFGIVKQEPTKLGIKSFGKLPAKSSYSSGWSGGSNDVIQMVHHNRKPERDTIFGDLVVTGIDEK